MPRTSPRKRRARLAAGGGAAALVVGVAFVFSRSALASSDTSGNYRTAVVTQSAVVESLQRTGTIEPISQASVAFPITGKVASVSVHTGQAVSTGDVLATLDTTSLQSQLAQKQAALAQAQLTLQQAVTAANNAAAAAAASAAAARATTTTTSPTTAAAAAPKNTVSTDAVNAVTQSQQDVDASMARAKDSLQFAVSTCGDSSSSSQQCLSAQQAALSDQETVAAAQKNLATAETALAKSLQSASPASSPATSNRATPASSQASGQSGGSASGGAAAARSNANTNSTTNNNAAGTPTITPEQLVADQAAVDAAQAEIAVVQQNLAQATIVSPIAGTVEAVNLAPNASVSAGSTTATIVVVGAGGFEVATTVDVNDLPKLKVGNPATVTPDGGADKVDGQVVAIGVLPTTSGTSTTYPVIIGLNTASNSLHAGASTAVSIAVASTATAATVPTSAVHAAGNLHFVSVLSNGKAVNTPVQTGTIGPERTEIVSGLSVGQVVVVADLSQPLPSSNTTSRFGAGAGGLGGGFGGGFGGAGAGGAGGVRIARGG